MLGWCPTAVNAIVEFQRISALWAIGRNTRPKSKRDYRSKPVRSSPFDQGHTNTARVETSDAIRYKEHPWKHFTRSVIDAFLGGRFRHDRLS